MLRDMAVLLGILPEWAYWHARAEWGMSRSEIYGTAAIAAGAVVFAVVPEMRSSGAAAFAYFPWFRRRTEKLHHARWFYVTRVLILFAAIVYVGSVLVTSAPTVFGQGRGTTDRELSDHNARVRALEEWRRSVDAMNVPGRIMLIEQDVREIKEEQQNLTRLVWGTLVGICIWLIQQLFLLLMKRAPGAIDKA